MYPPPPILLLVHRAKFWPVYSLSINPVCVVEKRGYCRGHLHYSHVILGLQRYCCMQIGPSLDWPICCKILLLQQHNEDSWDIILTGTNIIHTYVSQLKMCCHTKCASQQMDARKQQLSTGLFCLKHCFLYMTASLGPLCKEDLPINKPDHFLMGGKLYELGLGVEFIRYLGPQGR